MICICWFTLALSDLLTVLILLISGEQDNDSINKNKEFIWRTEEKFEVNTEKEIIDKQRQIEKLQYEIDSLKVNKNTNMVGACSEWRSEYNSLLIGEAELWDECKAFKHNSSYSSVCPSGLRCQLGKPGIAGSISGGDIYFLRASRYSQLDKARQLKSSMTFIQRHRCIEIDIRPKKYVFPITRPITPRNLTNIATSML